MNLTGGADVNNLSDNNIGVVANSAKNGFDIKLSKRLNGPQFGNDERTEQ